MLAGKKILIGITGSIAAYKTILLIRLLVKAKAEVKIVMTPASEKFVSTLVLSTLSNNKVLSEFSHDNEWANHVMLGRWADIFVITPLTCNTLAKMAIGICDNLLLSIYLSAICPVLIAPAMDEDMWLHSSTKENLEKLSSRGIKIINVGKGELASGLHGEGRIAEPEAILIEIQSILAENKMLQGKHVLVTAGPTHEPIDPVRYIGNKSSGKMGIAIAEALQHQGAVVTLILGPTYLSSPINNTIHVISSDEMYAACMKDIGSYDIVIMAAAVADFKPSHIAEQKLKKEEIGYLDLKLVQTEDILKSVGNSKKSEQILIGFALETTNEIKNALNKLHNKNLNLIVLNSLNDEAVGFGKETNKITIFDDRGKQYTFDAKSKKDVAKDIVSTIIEYQNV